MDGGLVLTNIPLTSYLVYLLYNRVYLGIQTALVRFGLKREVEVEEVLDDYTFQLLFAIIKDFNQEVREDSGTLMVVLMPSKNAVVFGGDELESEMNGRIKNFCSKAGIEVIEPLPEFLEQQGRNLYMNYDSHINKNGHNL